MIDNKSGKTAVVVNDDPTQRNILCVLANHAGLESLPFEGAEAALAAMNPDDPPALIITDVYMPGIDGWRFCRLLRSPEYAFCNEVPILVVSATFAGEHPEHIAADIGADAFLSSPVIGKEFVAQVQALLAGKERRCRPRALIVEDSRPLAGLLQKKFVANGYDTDTALTIREAEAAFDRKAYDIAVLDYHLPDGKGDVLLEALRARHPDCVFVMMTTDPTPELALDWMKRGASAYLRKPFEPEYLIELCAKARRERALLRAENLLEVRTRELRQSESSVRNRLKAILEPQGDFGDLDLCDILDIPAMQSLMENFHRITGMGNAIVDCKGNVLVSIGWQDICTRFHRRHPETLKNCVESDTNLARGAAPGNFKAYCCRNGLWDMASPIMVAGRHMGNIYFGQFFYADEVPDVERFRDQARRHGFDEEQYLAALGRVPHYRRQTVQDVMAFYSRLAQMISSLGFSSVSLARTITKLKQTEDNLRKSEEKYRLIFDNVGEAVFIAQDGMIKLGNHNIETLTGFTMAELMTEPFGAFIHPDDRQWISERHLARLRGKLPETERYEFRAIHKSGETLTVQLSTALMEWDGKPATINFLTDITERKRAEEALSHAHEALALAQQASGAGTWNWDMATGKLEWSHEFFRLFGLDPTKDQAGIEVWRAVVHPDDRLAAEERIQASIRDHVRLENEYRIVLPTGDIRWINALGDTIYDADSRAVRMVGICLNITTRKQAEAALRESEERLRFALETSYTGAWDLSLADHTAFRSLEHDRIFGYEDLLPTWTYEMFLDHVLPEDRPFVNEAFRQATAIGGDWNFECRIRRVDGQIRWIWAAGRHRFDDSRTKRRMAGIVQDITERKQAEEEKEKLQAQLAQAQKMESVGRLAGGVAHDFNNMLHAILGNTSMALEDIEPKNPARHCLLEIQKCAQRSADLTQQLLAFARKQTVAPQVLDLNQTVEGMLKMLRRLIGEDIDLAWLPKGNIGPVFIDPSQVNQILANLCVNARDAIADVGKITIETENVFFDEAYCADHAGFVPGKFVMLAVSDDGCGMDAETRRHIFEPFFTTKEIGKGTGLGLATIYGIVKQNNGFINVYSEPGQGTTFKIYLPRHAAREAARTEQEHTRIPAACSGTILLVEDEPVILQVSRMMLEKLGYTVIAANTPGEAIRLARERQGGIDLLMTDVVMPEMNGRDLAANLMSIHPNIRRLFMSGYTANVIAHHGVLDPGVHFILKPFSLKDLAATIREALDH